MFGKNHHSDLSRSLFFETDHDSDCSPYPEADHDLDDVDQLSDHDLGNAHDRDHDRDCDSDSITCGGSMIIRIWPGAWFLTPTMSLAEAQFQTLTMTVTMTLNLGYIWEASS